MLSQEQRTAVLELHKQRIGTREIARVLGISRGIVKKVIRKGSAKVPEVERPEKAAPYQEEIARLHALCKGNLVRVHEELLAQGAALSYPALTAYCRRHRIGHSPPKPVGQYHFSPGAELQHDTSPHLVELAGGRRRVQTASAVLCYSRMLYCQCYPSFTRFECKCFLADALAYFGATTRVVMVDNTHVVVASGTGRAAIIAPEMEAFAQRYGFAFVAHEKGDVNRSARVEGPFDHIEGNFLAGRVFTGFADLNAQAVAWCDKVNATTKRRLQASPRELLAAELPHLLPLPLWVPQVVQVHRRTVDVEGYVCLHTNRYSVPPEWIGRAVEVRESATRLEMDLGRGKTITHTRQIGVRAQRVTLPEHRFPRGARPPRDPHPEEKAILELAPELAGFVSSLKTHGRRSPTLALRHLLRIVREYPREAMLGATAEASTYGLFDLDRVERMVLRRVAHEYFQLGGNHDR